jgi:hypothetical protein
MQQQPGCCIPDLLHFVEVSDVLMIPQHLTPKPPQPKGAEDELVA